MKKSEWKNGIVRPAIKHADIYGAFAVHAKGDEYNVTHRQSGFLAHKSHSLEECMDVAEALDKLPFWPQVKLDEEAGELVHWEPEWSEMAIAAKKSVTDPKRGLTQQDISR
jgi:hypothetical protein